LISVGRALKTHKRYIVALVFFTALGTGSLRAHDDAHTKLPIVTLDLASTFPGSMPILGNAAEELSRKVQRASAGKLSFKFYEPGVLVPGSETVNAVAEGKVAAAWAGAGWFAKRDSAFNFFSSVPFGPGIGEYLAWMYKGGGLELAREMFHAQGVHNVPCGLIPPEASGWFRKEIRSVKDLKGLKMRFFGLGAKVMQKLGVETVQLPPGEILAALKSGKLNATEFSLPAMDKPLGFQKLAKYYYFPGWHQQATFFDLYVNLDIWETLPDRYRSIIELACSRVELDMIAEGEAMQGEAIEALKKEGVQVRRWAPAMLAAFDKAWNEVVSEESAANPNFKRIYDSYTAFRQKYKVWHYLSYLD
jgi:TRAP-type mannitol/chloroaromatic compound transport system substrate-binding protein